MDYYTPITILIWIALLVMCILVHENNRFTQEKKYILYFTYILLGCAALFEWLGVQLNGNMKFSPWLLRVVKLFDYILTPIAGGVVVLQFQTKGLFKKLIFIFIGFNILYQFKSIVIFVVTAIASPISISFCNTISSFAHADAIALANVL